MSEIIRVRCGGCDVKIKAPLKYQGRKVNCPQCGHDVKIPKLKTAAQSASSGASAKAVSPAVVPITAKAKPSRSAAAKPVIVEEEQPMELGDDAFVDEKPRSKSSVPIDDFADFDANEFDDYGEVEDYGDPDDYGATAKPRARSRSRSSSSPARKKKRKKKPASSDDSEIDGSILGGIGMMVLGGGLFFGLWAYGIIWPYAGIIFVVGMVAFVKGLID